MATWTMPVKSGGGGGTEKAPAGNHLAVMVGLFRMGTQLDDYDPNNEKWQKKVYLVWELLGVKMTGMKDRNHVIGAAVTESTNEKATFRKWVEARTGRRLVDDTDFNPLSELGQPCMLNVVMKGDWPRVDSVAAVPAAFLASLPKPSYPLTSLVDLEELRSGAFTVPEWVPWVIGCPLGDWIKASKELGGARPRPRKGDRPAQPGGEYVSPGKDDVIPF